MFTFRAFQSNVHIHVQSSKWGRLIAVDIRLSDKSSSVAATSIFAINDYESIR